MLAWLLPWGEGNTLVCLYIRRLGSFFFVQNFEFQYFLGFSQKLISYGVMLWIFLGGHHKNGLYLGVISIPFRVFS